MIRKYNRYTKELLEPLVKGATSIAGVARLLGKSPTGGTIVSIGKLIRKFEIDNSHFTGSAHGKGKRSLKRVSAAERLVYNSDRDYRISAIVLKRALDELIRPYVCVDCGNDGKFNGKLLTLQIDHIDGDIRNNTPSNLRYLCPNCHSQTSTYCKRKRD